MSTQFLWTKENIKKVAQLWSYKTMGEIGAEIGCSASQVSYIASEIRKSGFNLPKKKVKGRIRDLINESLKETDLLKVNQ